MKLFLNSMPYLTTKNNKTCGVFAIERKLY